MNKQSEIIKFLSTVESATKSEIYESVPFGYYHNWQKHLGEILSRMVKDGKIKRVKIGVYKYDEKSQGLIKQITNENQTALFP